MRIAIIGRTKDLLDTAKLLVLKGHVIGLVAIPYEDSSFNEFAEQCSADLIVGTNINSDTTIARIQRASCEVAVSVNWITLIRHKTLLCFRHGILNAHGGDLPRYRGNACQNWAILRNEKKIGLCIHKMTTELDAGPIYSRDYFQLSPDTYVTDIYEWFSRRIPVMFAETIDKISNGIMPTPQDNNPENALRCYPRRPSDSRIIWTNSADEIHRLIRASSRPFDGAFCFLEDGRKVVVWRAEVVVPLGGHIAMPGQPCEPFQGDPVIACGSGFLRLTEVSIDKIEINKSVRRRLI